VGGCRAVSNTRGKHYGGNKFWGGVKNGVYLKGTSKRLRKRGTDGKDLKRPKRFQKKKTTKKYRPREGTPRKPLGGKTQEKKGPNAVEKYLLKPLRIAGGVEKGGT